VLHRWLQSVEELAAILGIGPSWCARHAESLLAELRELWAA
jgi:hypothetical protein